MSDFQKFAAESVQRVQEKTSIGAGEFWMRGTALVLVTKVHGREYQVAWVDEIGDEKLKNVSNFFERALTRLGTVSAALTNYLDNAWDIASARGVPSDVRVVALAKTLRRAPDQSSHLAVLRWSRSLSLNQEPRRVE